MKSESPYHAALAYWAGLEAPKEIVAAALRRSLAEVIADMAAVTPPEGLGGYPSSVSWKDRTISAIVRRGLAGPDTAQLVFVAGEGALTVSELRGAVARTAAGLQAAGVGHGDRVAVDATQRLESLIVVAATLLIGAVVVRLSLVTGADGVRAMLAAAPPKITFSEMAEHLRPQDGAGLLVGLTKGGSTLVQSFDDWMDSLPPVASLPEVVVGPTDLALIGFTSGSTGVPKRVETSHLAAFRATEAMVAMFGFGPDDIFCTATDFSALSAFRSMLSVPFLCGGRVVLPSEQAREQPLALAMDCTTYGVTRLTAIPNVLRGLARGAARAPPGTLGQLRMVFSGSGVLDQATRHIFHAAFPVPVIDYYGGREFATALYARADTGFTVSSGGGVLCNCIIRIVDDAGAEVPDGEVGEIMVHSDCLTSSELAGTHPDWQGWHQSGDLGRVTSQGLIQVVGRRRDVIKAADGSLVFPVEIEAILQELPQIDEACVMGQTMADGTERILAAVLLASGDAAIEPADIEHAARAHVLARIGRFRVPYRVIPVAGFPRTGAGKIDKSVLRQQLSTTGLPKRTGYVGVE